MCRLPCHIRMLPVCDGSSSGGDPRHLGWHVGEAEARNKKSNWRPGSVGIGYFGSQHLKDRRFDGAVAILCHCGKAVEMHTGREKRACREEGDD